MRPLSELLQLVYDLFNSFVYDEKNVVYSGLCYVIHDLYFSRIISKDEFSKINNYIIANRPKSVTGSYYWEPFESKNRNKFLLKHIKINKIKENGKSKN